MAEVTIQYRSRVVGHPEPGFVITVERTAMVDAVLAAGLAVIIEPDGVPADDE